MFISCSSLITERVVRLLESVSGVCLHDLVALVFVYLLQHGRGLLWWALPGFGSALLDDDILLIVVLIIQRLLRFFLQLGICRCLGAMLAIRQRWAVAISWLQLNLLW